MGVASHAVDDEGDVVEVAVAAGGQYLLGSPHIVDDDGLAELMGEDQVAHEGLGLRRQFGPAQGVDACLADGKHLGVAGALLKQAVIVIGEGVDAVPGMKAHRIPLSRLRVKATRIHRNEGCGGFEPMGMDIEDGVHGTGS